MTRAIDWLDHATLSVQVHERAVGNSAGYVVERLASLLLERLPPRLSNQMMRMLPREVALAHESLFRPANGPGDRSIGYMSFVETANEALGVCEEGQSLSDVEADEISRRVADAFLWAVAQELPPDLKSSFVALLPLDLRSRMNIYSDIADDARVA